MNAYDEDGDTCLHLALNDKLANSDSSSKHINSAAVDLKDCKLLLMVNKITLKKISKLIIILKINIYFFEFRYHKICLLSIATTYVSSSRPI